MTPERIAELRLLCPVAAPDAQGEWHGMLDEIERLRSWEGVMSQLDEHYPADIFDGSSGDTGTRLVALAREVERLRAVVARVEVLAVEEEVRGRMMGDKRAYPLDVARRIRAAIRGEAK